MEEIPKYRRQKKIITVLIILLGITLFRSYFLITDHHSLTEQLPNKEINNLNEDNKLNLAFDASILIDSDDDFETYGFNGTGTESDPYLIENIVINISDTYSMGISIEYTTKYFIIRNCIIDINVYGVYLFEIASGTAQIINNTIFSCYFGIAIQFASGTSIMNNSITRYRWGSWPFAFETTIASIQCWESNDLKVVNNNCSFAMGAGIYLRGSMNIEIRNILCNYSLYGIYCTFSTFVNISNCLFAHHRYAGIELNGGTPSSHHVAISNNQFIDCGLVIKSVSFPLIIQNNTVNDKLLGFFEYKSGLVLNKPVYGQIILHECNSTIIANQVMEEVSIGIVLLDSSNLTITNNTLTKSYKGVFISRCYDLLFSYNNCSLNYDCGIYIISSFYSEYSNNTCNNNWNEGILFDGNRGRYIGAEPHHNLVFNNTIKNNEYGIYLWYTDYTEISYNLLQDNLRVGVSIGMNSESNVVHHNKFKNNWNNWTGTQGLPQGAQDSPTESPNNLWYDPLTNEGNYWSDWDCTGPYRIYCYEDPNIYDLYPLYDPTMHCPKVNPPPSPPSPILSYKLVLQIMFLSLCISLISLFVIRRLRASKKFRN